MSQVEVNLAAVPNIQRLLPRHFKIIELFLAGHSIATIAEALEMSSGAVSLILKSPLIQHELATARKQSREPEVLALDRDALRSKVNSILETATVKAAAVQVELLDNPNPAIALKASTSILDRVYGDQKSAGGGGLVINITAENVALVNQALKESQDARWKQPADRTAAPSPEASEHFDVHQGSQA